MAPWQDSGIFYTHLLSEAVVLTKLDLYSGLPHFWWCAYPTDLDITEVGKRYRGKRAMFAQ